ncbi:MAG: septum formation inhibitor Maf [Burkholderiales bacterium]|nr:septum formation inhibitor Maf [Burkholderiales bacterium]
MSHAPQKVYLASKSPRRRELLRQADIDFELLLLREDVARGADVTEITLPNESPEAYVARVTQAKALAAWHVVLARHLPAHPVLAADTTVVIDGQILGKPTDKADATRILTLLSGRSHQVLTNIAVKYHQQFLQCTQTSEVRFAHLSASDIAAYCDTQEPYDKAGAYGVQGVAARFISHISGSYSGIMGLPIFETAELLARIKST